MSRLVYLNGQFVEHENAKVHVYDHGFLYGDGVFEGIRSYNRLVFKLDEHIDRLYETAHTLLIEIPLSKKQMVSAIVDTLKKNNLSDAGIRLSLKSLSDLGNSRRHSIFPHLNSV